jgi:hypothetical protein
MQYLRGRGTGVRMTAAAALSEKRPAVIRIFLSEVLRIRIIQRRLFHLGMEIDHRQRAVFH